MERKIISHRIGSILDDISRLSNALYAMDTTDIQRYPDNYEVLSTDAALRAEKIACRLRHLIYSSTTIRKGDYLTSAGIVHGIEVVYEDGVLEVTLPGLLPKRKQRQNTEFLLDPFYFSLEQYAKEHPMPRFSDCVVCFTQVYDQCLPTRRIRDYDNLEEKQLLDVLSTFVMADDMVMPASMMKTVISPTPPKALMAPPAGCPAKRCPAYWIWCLICENTRVLYWVCWMAKQSAYRKIPESTAIWPSTVPVVP